MSHSSNENVLKSGNEFAKLQRKANQQAAMQEAEKQVEWYSLVIKYRNLTTRETLVYYDSLVFIEAISPEQNALAFLDGLGFEISKTSIRKASQWGNTKRDTIKQLTWQLNKQEDGDSYIARCPCCQRLVAPTRATWLIKPYYIASGFIKVCRGCASKYGSGYNFSDGSQCISVYHPQYIQCYNEHGHELALNVFREYIARGIVFDAKYKLIQEKADTYMAHVISKLDSSMSKEKK